MKLIHPKLFVFSQEGDWIHDESTKEIISTAVRVAAVAIIAVVVLVVVVLSTTTLIVEAIGAILVLAKAVVLFEDE